MQFPFRKPSLQNKTWMDTLVTEIKQKMLFDNDMLQSI